ncbi:hypothetical protein BLA34_15145 [Ralstonia solanacearum]|nr:hypothetical protein BLA34_15145 [Ralstonia solanacearum]
MFQRAEAWIFFILGVPVYVRELPAENITVFHPFNEAVRGIVEPICNGRGYWRSDYKNWVIFDQFRDVVLGELRQHAV